MEELTTCVVLTGPPINDAPRMTILEANWEENPSMGLIL
jgi:hypothetical protein